MPFGALFASLLLGLVGLFLQFSALGAPSAPAALSRVALGLICLNCAIGLLRRQAWARWGALFVAVVLLVLNDLLAPPGGAVAKLTILLGAALAIVLLALPPTGRLERPAEEQSNTLALASIASLVALGVALAWGASSGPAPSNISGAPLQIAGLGPRVAWSDFGAGIERAAAESKPLFVVFETGWCGYCRKMNRTTFKDPAVAELLNEIVAVKVNAEDDTRVGGFSGRELASRYGVSGYPSLMVLDSDGRVLARTSGFVASDALLDWIESVTRSVAAQR